jgi:hypothetical protein
MTREEIRQALEPHFPCADEHWPICMECQQSLDRLLPVVAALLDATEARERALREARADAKDREQLR